MKPYIVAGGPRDHYEVWTRGKAVNRWFLGSIYDVPKRERAKRGRWEVRRGYVGTIIGSAGLLREAAEMLWRSVEDARVVYYRAEGFDATSLDATDGHCLPACSQCTVVRRAGMVDHASTCPKYVGV